MSYFHFQSKMYCIYAITVYSCGHMVCMYDVSFAECMTLEVKAKTAITDQSSDTTTAPPATAPSSDDKG